MIHIYYTMVTKLLYVVSVTLFDYRNVQRVRLICNMLYYMTLTVSVSCHATRCHKSYAKEEGLCFANSQRQNKQSIL